MDQATSTECHDVNHLALTTLQRQLWVQSQVGTAASLAYNISINLSLQGRLDRRLLREAIEYVWGRHDAMRTTICADGRFQTCHRQMKADAKLIDLSSVDSGQREAMLEKEIARNNEQAFDFQAGPLFRVRVYKCDQTNHLLMLTAHHIVSDGWSLVLILREIADYYKSAYSGGWAASAPPMQYPDFVAEEQRRAAEGGREKSDKYWRNILQAPLPVMDLPLDFQRPNVRSFRAGRMHRRLPASQTLKLRDMARRGGTTLFMLLYGAFSILLHRICKQDDLIIGTPSAGRFADGSDSLVGYCGSLLPIRNRYDGSRSFTEHMHEVRRTLLDAYDHQEVSFAELIGDLPLSRAANRSALVDAIFNLEPPVPMPSIPGLALTVEPQPTPYSSYDFFFNVSELNDELSLDLDFNRDILRPETVDSMLSAYLALLDDAFRNPGKSLAQLDLIGDAGRKMLDLLNNTTTLAPATNLIHESIEANARSLPDITALVFGDLCISYAALNARANQLAYRLRQCGVGPEVRVGLCVERSIEQFVALLAIHKAGGAYVPLDPDYPVERLRFCVEDAGIRLLLTQQATRDLLQIDGLPVFEIDDFAELDGCPTDDLPPTATSTNLAYIIYTSGSTGHPKGVAVTHASVVNLMMAMNDRPGLSRDDRLLGITTFAFDMSVVELFLPLTNAATLVVAPRGAVFNGDAFIAHMLDQQVNVLQATPAAWRLFLGKGDHGPLDVKMLCGGEALSAALCQQLLEHGSEVWNMYGPTEATVWSSCHRCDGRGEHNMASDHLPVGKPLANTFFYLLDEQLQPVPSGFPGILYIGGSGLARGYWGKPDLTAERFVPDPFVTGPGARMYDTGDLARCLSDGMIDIIGRTDNQVKVRGFRIELGEIEAVFSGHPKVRHAAVVVSRDKRGDNRLHAYYEAHNAIDRTELRTYLKGTLPPYMIPASISELASLPLTSTGKIDRRALADSEHQQAVSETGHVAPRNSLEASMCEAWRELLEVPLVGIDDDFFVLGGHSLLAAELVTRVRESMSVPVTLAGILSNPTVRQLVQSLNQLKDDAISTEDALPQITPDPDRQFEPFPLTDIQQAYWIGRSPSLELGNTPAFNYSEATLDHCDPAALERAWNILMMRHDMLRMCVNDQGAQYIKPDWPHVSIPFQDFSALDTAACTAALLEVREQMTNRDSSEATWSELRLSKLHENSYVIHIYLDMMAFDGASLHILYRELAALLRDPSSKLPPLGVTFRDYVLTEDKLRETQAYKRARAYWMSRIESMPPAPQLPLDCPPSSIAKPKFRRWSEALASARWQALKKSALHRGITPSVLTLTAFCEVLGHWTGQRRFTINLTLFNRLALHPEINDVIGDFTSLNLLEIDQSRDLTFHDRARANQHQLWSDLEHRHFGGVRVIRELNRRRGSGPAAAMPVVFTSDLSIEQRAATDRLEQQLSDQRIGISNTPQTWMDVAVMESEDTLVILMDAVEALFPSGLLDDMFSAYCGLLERLADDELAWDEAYLLTLPERQTVVRGRVNATSEELAEGLLHAGFLEQASRHPEALAVWSSGRCLSYGQLRHLARHYAHQLRTSGDVSNRLVGVVMRKGWEQVVAVLAIAEAGAAYLPIDAELPEARIVQLLALGEVGHVLTQPGLAADVNWPDGVFCRSVESAALEAPEPAALVPMQAPDSLAYVIFTSGSTGQPKGVMIDHRGARNTIESINRLFDVGVDDRALALSSLSFDLSVYDIFGLLSAGGAVVIPDSELEKDPAHWSQLLETGRVSVWNTVPALMQLLVEYHEQQGLALPSTLREVLLSGDWIPVTLPDRIRALGPQVRVTSLGGATEASIWSIHYPVGEVDSEWKSIPYGRPLANQSYHVLDAFLRPCPDWVVGDLYIGGVGLAQGYWRDEARTAASFIVHPESGERLYRTGDKGRYHPDGDIEFLGREDGQVKIQGYRVELGEIEVALGRQPGVRESVVIAVGDGTGPKRLVGYVVMASPDGQQATLQDAVERTLFKLGRPGLRRVDGAGHALARAPLPLGHVSEPGVWHEQAPPLESLGCWLDALSAHPVEGSVLPKYHYPSSGSLNPIQVYLEVGPEVHDGLESGSYYYDPVAHRLQRVADWHGSRPGVMVHLVAALEAVSPLYGESAEVLCALEAGYVAELLRMTAPVQGIGLRPVSSESGLERRLALTSGHCVQASLAVGSTAPQEALLGLGLLERQSYREFASRALSEEQLQALLGSVQVVPGLDWYVHIKPDGVEGREAGYYGLDASSGCCELLHAETALPATRYGGGNAEIFRLSGVAIYALGAAGSAQLQGAGSQGQRLSTVGVKAGVGVCPIGGFDATGLHERLGVDASVEVVHSWLAGPIDPDQSERWEQESAPVMDAGERCRQGLQEELPGYMVPGVVMVLERMPLTGNGKVDRRALPEPLQREREQSFAAPRTAMEKQLAEVWAEVLGRDRIGLNDQFFEIGGDSLKVVQVQTRLRSGMRADISLHELYAHPTLIGLAALLDGKESAPVTAEDSSIKAATLRQRTRRRVKDEHVHPLSDAQYRLWFADRVEGPNVLFNFPAALVFDGLVELDMLNRAFQTVARRHLVLTSRMEERPEGPVQIFNPDFRVRIPVVDLSMLPEQSRRQVGEKLRYQEAQRVFTLSTGPLFHILQLRVDSDCSHLLLNMHHIVSDGWSSAIFLRELLECFRVQVSGLAPRLPRLDIQYSDFVYWQQERLATHELADSLAWWRRNLAELPTLHLPLDRERQRQRSTNGDVVRRVLSTATVARFRDLADAESCTLFSVLLAAFKVLLAYYDGGTDVVVGTSVASRPLPELESLVGLFVNQVVLRTQLDGNPEFSELAKRVSDTSVNALANQEVPFDQVVATLAHRREAGLSPLFQVLFLLNNMPKQAITDTSGIAVEVESITSQAARFDLSLTLDDDDGVVVANWGYRTDIFDRKTIDTMADRYEAILERVGANPALAIADIDPLTPGERRAMNMKMKKRQGSRSNRFKGARREAIDLGRLELVKEGTLEGVGNYPLVMTPARAGVDLAQWAESAGEQIEQQLLRHGAILFRGFGIDSVERFERFACSICPDLAGDYGDLPKEARGEKIYKSTPYPEDKTILFHNESSHTHRWPMKQFFGCLQVAREGGETPIVDCRMLFQKLDPAIAKRFADRGLLYQRNFIKGLDVSWQNFFKTEDRSEVESRLSRLGDAVTFEWIGEEDLRVNQWAPAVARHPKTGDCVFFNQIQLHHIGCLEQSDRESLLALFNEQDLPRNVYYGDGTAIEPEVIAEINRLYSESAVSFPWEIGDVLMLDNMLSAHARNPFKGSRKVIVAMGEMIEAVEIDSTPTIAST